MRSRFSHEGSLDHHADNEHDLLRRADEALERQRQEAHAAMAVGQSAHGNRPAPHSNGIATPISTGPTTLAAAMPKMPHEEIAERFALKPATPPTIPSHGRKIR